MRKLEKNYRQILNSTRAYLKNSSNEYAIPDLWVKSGLQTDKRGLFKTFEVG